MDFFDQQLKDQQKKLEDILATQKKSLGGFQKVMDKLSNSFLPVSSKKVITPSGTATANLLKGGSVKVDFATEEAAKRFYESLQEFNTKS